MSVNTKMTAIADEIRELSGTTGAMGLDDMASTLREIPKNDSSDLTASGATVTVPAGYYASQATKSVATETQATPAITVDASGLITATATQTAGYVVAGSKSATKQLAFQPAKTITPSTASQIAVSSGYYTGGDITVKGDSNLVAGNIKSGVSIFGVTGTHNGGSGDGAAVETCTVDIATSEGTLSCIIYLCLVDGKVTTVYLDFSSGDLIGQSIVLNDVVCGSFLSVLISSNMYGIEKNTGLVMMRNNTYWKITVGSGETAILRFHNPF